MLHGEKCKKLFLLCIYIVCICISRYGDDRCVVLYLRYNTTQQSVFSNREIKIEAWITKNIPILWNAVTVYKSMHLTVNNNGKNNDKSYNDLMFSFLFTQ